MNSAKLIRFQKKKRLGSTFEQKAKLFLETTEKLFDIAALIPIRLKSIFFNFVFSGILFMLDLCPYSDKFS